MKKNTVKTVSLLKQQKILQWFILGTKYIIFYRTCAKQARQHHTADDYDVKAIAFFRGAQNVTPAFYFQEKTLYMYG